MPVDLITSEDQPEKNLGANQFSSYIQVQT